eukprot:342841-Rhodomonas_salina.1
MPRHLFGVGEPLIVELLDHFEEPAQTTLSCDLREPFDDRVPTRDKFQAVLLVRRVSPSQVAEQVHAGARRVFFTLDGMRAAVSHTLEARFLQRFVELYFGDAVSRGDLVADAGVVDLFDGPEDGVLSASSDE